MILGKIFAQVARHVALETPINQLADINTCLPVSLDFDGIDIATYEEFKKVYELTSQLAELESKIPS